MKYACILVLLLYSCGQKSDVIINYNVDNITFKDSVKLFLDKEVYFDLDSLTVPENKSVSYFNDRKRQEYLSILNENNNSIYIYKLGTKSIHKIVAFSKEGQNGVGNLEGHYIKNEDSIFVFNKSKETLFLVGYDGKVQTKYKINSVSFSKGQTAFPVAEINTRNHILFTDSILYMSGFNYGETEYLEEDKRPVDLLYFLRPRSNQFQYGEVHYPKCYKNTNWGGDYYREVYTTFGASPKQVFSFPASHYLTVKNLNSLNPDIREYYAGSRFIKEIIPCDYPKKFNNNEKSVLTANYWTRK